MVIARIRSLISHPFMPAAFFFSGVTFDSVTLTQIDSLLDDLILLGYLALVGLLIVLTFRAERIAAQRVEAGAGGAGLAGRLRPYYPMAIHFFLGSLFSAQSIFYLKSASWSTTALFLVVLVALLLANEFLLERLYSLRLLACLYALVCFSFITFFLPVVTGLMNTAVFLIGAGLSAGIAVGLVHLVHRGTDDWSHRDVWWHGTPAVLGVSALVGFYFLNWIPPVPLSMKRGGIYHQVAREDGIYRLTFEQGGWYQAWKRSDDLFHGEGPAYCFTAIYAPVRLHGTIYHRWQHRQANGDFAQTDRIGMTISGGREGGYRGYTVKQKLAPGDWRVDVETADDRIIGRIAFQVEPQAEALLALESVTD
ncbi:MAG: DUF2914 domain-containing protein [Nitrospirae bacterium]|nr:MAG: DUF2914 domain-containing protein [Nitrospirota bacterium]